MSEIKDELDAAVHLLRDWAPSAVRADPTTSGSLEATAGGNCKPDAVPYSCLHASKNENLGPTSRWSSVNLGNLLQRQKSPLTTIPLQYLQPSEHLIPMSTSSQSQLQSIAQQPQSTPLALGLHDGCAESSSSSAEEEDIYVIEGQEPLTRTSSANTIIDPEQFDERSGRQWGLSSSTATPHPSLPEGQHTQPEPCPTFAARGYETPDPSIHISVEAASKDNSSIASSFMVLDRKTLPERTRRLCSDIETFTENAVNAIAVHGDYFLAIYLLSQGVQRLASAGRMVRKDVG